MRILMLLENDFTNDRRVEKEIRSLISAGHNLVLAAITSDQDAVNVQWGKCKVYKKHIAKLRKKSFVTALVLPIYFSYWRKYVHEIISKEEPFDVVHVHDLPLAVIGIELKKKLNIKLVIDLHENFPALIEITRDSLPFFGKPIVSVKQWYNYETESLKSADKIIAVVHEMKERLVKYGIESGKISILENVSLLPESFPAYRNNMSGKLRLIYIGGINFHRGLQVVIEGLSVISTKNEVELIIVGDGSYLKNIRELCARLDLLPCVQFTGNLNRNDAEEYLLQSDIALIPHLRSEQTDNSSPNKLYEYMAAGIPVIASNCTSVKRVIEETGCGLTYIYDSPEDFASKINEINIDRENLIHYSRNGITAVKNKYNWEMNSRQLIELYNSFNN